MKEEYMILEYFINGVLIGLVFGMPIGAVGAMSIQRTINHGVVAGFISGAASSIADVLYACVGAFGLTVISDFLLTNQMPIHMIGACLLILIAIRMITKKEMMLSAETADVKDYLKMFLSSFAVAITNPAAIISFLFAFSVFGINGTLGFSDGIQLVTGVFLGTLCWWLLLVVLVNFMKKKLTERWLYRLNVLFGLILIVFSCCVCIKTL